MKTLYTVLLLTAIGSLAFSQTPVQFGFYRWNSSVPIRESSRDGSLIANSLARESLPGQSFRVVDFLGETNVVIKILPYTKRVSKTLVPSGSNFFKFNFNGSQAEYDGLDSLDKEARNYGKFQKYFLVPKEYIVSYATMAQSKGVDLSVGVLTLPVKMRLKDGDYGGNFSIGASGGIKIRHSRYKDDFHNILIGVGFSNVNLDSNTVRRNQQAVISDLNALTYSIGYLFQKGRAQLGLFIGSDFLTYSNQKRFGWRYQGSPWVSIVHIPLHSLPPFR